MPNGVFYGLPHSESEVYYGKVNDKGAKGFQPVESRSTTRWKPVVLYCTVISANSGR